MGAGSPASAPSGPPGDLETQLRGWTEEIGAPGAAVAIIDGTGLEEAAVGSGRDAGAEPRLIGSVSKTVAATLVLQLARDGILGLDDAAQDWVPGAATTATVRQLLSHEGGYTAQDGLAVSERGLPEQPLADVAARLPHSGTVGTYAYSSANFLVLGAVIESAAGQSFSEVLQSRIAGPAGLDSLTVDPGPGARADGSRLRLLGASAYEGPAEPTGAPYGYLSADLGDLAGYARAQLDGTLLGADDTAEAWSPQTPEREGRSCGLGWHLLEAEGRELVHHTGATPGTFTHLVMEPATGRAVVLIVDAYSEAQAPRLAAAAPALLTTGSLDDGSGADPLLSTAPWIALGLAALGAVMLALAAWRLRRRGSLIAAGVLGLAVVGAVIAAPALLGSDAHTLRIWMPDLGRGLLAGLIVWALLPVLAALRLIRARRRHG